MSDKPVGKDGWRRNLAQFKLEWHVLRNGMKQDWRRWRKRPWPGSHESVNLFVESRRLAPYLMGHIDYLLYHVLIVALIGVAGLWRGWWAF